MKQTQRESGAEWNEFARRCRTLEDNVARVVRGRSEAIRLAVVCLIAEGHLLIEDNPGVGKTSLARAMAQSLDAEWNRVQFTPDLLPSDVTGYSMYNQRDNDMEFRPGPVFTHILLGDEINRAPAKTQAALLQAMEERRVTNDGVTRDLPEPFMVIATQNAVETDGTYPLPEAELDRFLMKISIGYPPAETEAELVRTQLHVTAPNVDPVLSLRDLAAMTRAAKAIELHPDLAKYIVDLATATRNWTQQIEVGVSPRGSLALARSARARALVSGRSFVNVEDIQSLAPFVFAHRLVRTAEAELHDVSAADVMDGILRAVEVPAVGRAA